ncbi:hypothetical protein [Vibrio sp. SCSIO 43136]|uniref:hypothetical protein n=1 Tax=Vibrio sp. SCSIO 43136 TaxID=2819101 RepID=UPI002075B813|nr:hypothetical protein [Vibrio sp. SCSIO 43136]USD67718.1 hypothetical protein J4N39_16150 [Vibrio sp. SCSIO 43136]
MPSSNPESNTDKESGLSEEAKMRLVKARFEQAEEDIRSGNLVDGEEFLRELDELDQKRPADN